MRRRKKVRCTKPEEDDDLIRAPHSFVIRRGVLGNFCNSYSVLEIYFVTS